MHDTSDRVALNDNLVYTKTPHGMVLKCLVHNHNLVTLFIYILIHLFYLFTILFGTQSSEHQQQTLCS